MTLTILVQLFYLKVHCSYILKNEGYCVSSDSDGCNDRSNYLISPSASSHQKGRSNPQILPDKIQRSSFRPLDFIGKIRYYQKQRFLSQRKHRLKKINRAIEPIEMYNGVKDWRTTDPQTAKNVAPVFQTKQRFSPPNKTRHYHKGKRERILRFFPC